MVYNAHYLLDSMIPTGTGLYAPQYMTTINYIDNNNYYIAASGNVYGKVKLNTNNVIDTFWEYNNYDELNYYCTGGLDTFLDLGISTSYPYNTDTNSIYVYNSDSDISAIVAGGQVQTFVYDLTHTYQQGDVYRQYEVSQLGAPYAVSKHLVTQWDLNGGWSMKYSYTFDSVGRINRIVILTDTTAGVRIDTSTTTYIYNN